MYDLKIDQPGNMRYLILFTLLSLALATAQTHAQTRRIAAASHSGSATAQDEDHFGISPQQERQFRVTRDSLARVDSLRRDSVSSRVRVKVKPGGK